MTAATPATPPSTACAVIMGAPALLELLAPASVPVAFAGANFSRPPVMVKGVADSVHCWQRLFSHGSCFRGSRSTTYVSDNGGCDRLGTHRGRDALALQ